MDIDTSYSSELHESRAKWDVDKSIIIAVFSNGVLTVFGGNKYERNYIQSTHRY